MRVPILVGNDVVDLSDPRCRGRAQDERFVDRVCAAPEGQAVRSSRDPDLALWILWAGKEAAFKVVTKVLGRPPVFEHARFVVAVAEDGVGLSDPRSRLGPLPSWGGLVAGRPDPDPGDANRSSRLGARRSVGAESGSDATGHGTDDAAAPGSGPTVGLAGSVTFEDHRVFVQFGLHGRALHAVAWSPQLVGSHVARRIETGLRELPELPSDDPSVWRQRLAPRFSEREWRAVHHPASAWVRIHARAAAGQRLGLPDTSLEIVCLEGQPGRAPPRLEVEGRPAPLDVSLSHHGRYVAWALADGR